LKAKKIPLRKCIACGKSRPKKELIRIVKNNMQEVNLDLTGKMNGRGAYVCSNLNCYELAKKSKKLSRALQVEITNDIYEEIENSMEINFTK